MLLNLCLCRLQDNLIACTLSGEEEPDTYNPQLGLHSASETADR